MYDINREFVRNIYKNARISGIFVTNKGVITDKDLTLGMISEMKEDPDIDTQWIRINSKWKFLSVVHGTTLMVNTVLTSNQQLKHIPSMEGAK